MANKNLEVISRVEGELSEKDREVELNRLIDECACGIEAEPEWCVYGRHYKGGEGVLYWILPEPESQMRAYKIAKLINQLGGKARVEMTEWNKELTGEPVYKR